ncbi:MAG TPA: hypothetical protein VKP12_09380, partial [Kiloniellaceae bacterium]|nr:hypothetical protein [Kiloniellaceae bacterium]
MTGDREGFELRGARWLRRAAMAGALALAAGACAGPSEQPAAMDETPSVAEAPAEAPAATVTEEPVQATPSEPAGEPASEPAPLETAAPRDPFASSLIISGDSVTSSEQVAGLPLQTAAGPGQLAA